MSKFHKILSITILTVVMVALLLFNSRFVENITGFVKEYIESRSVTPDGIVVLMYHHLVEDLSPYEGNEAVVSVEQFRKQMQFLAEENFTTLNASRLLEYLDGTPVPERTVVITFDDGYESNYIYAYPILKEFGLNAIIHVIVAVTPGEIGGERKGIPKIDWEQMKTMLKSDTIDIQSHTFDSHYHAKVDKKGRTKPKLASRIWIEDKNRAETETEYIARITKDLQLSEKIIEDRLSNDVIAIAYPFGVHNDIIRQIIKDKTGIRLGFTVRPGRVMPGDDPLTLKRINVSPRWTLEDFRRVVQ